MQGPICIGANRGWPTCCPVYTIKYQKSIAKVEMEPKRELAPPVRIQFLDLKSRKQALRVYYSNIYTVPFSHFWQIGGQPYTSPQNFLDIWNHGQRLLFFKINTSSLPISSPGQVQFKSSSSPVQVQVKSCSCPVQVQFKSHTRFKSS